VKVLVVDDAPEVVESVRLGFAVQWREVDVLSAGTGKEALELVEQESPDLVLLDVGLPDMDGFKVLQEIRFFSDVPVVMLTARDDTVDKVKGLELGADDYVTKPFSPRELMLRVRAVLRRTAGAADVSTTRSYGRGSLVVEESTRTVTVRGQPVELTPTEWGLLLALSTTPGRVYSRAELINRVRGYEFEGYERSIDSHIKNLRRKIEADPPHPAIVVTVLGGGYRFGLTRDG
jgi:DNA-binding response OmpR family regulator